MANYNLIFLKMTPGPKGKSEYTDNQGGFDLWVAPTDTVANQGANIGGSVGTVIFTIKGGADVHETFLGATVGNSIKTTDVTYTNNLYFDNGRKNATKREYKEITFRGAEEVPQGGEFEGSVQLTFEYTYVKRSAISYKKNGQANPAVTTILDLRKGKIQTQ